VKRELTLPPRPFWLRLLIVGWGAVIFIWLSLEDNTALPVAILGTGAAFLFASQWLLSHFGGKPLAPAYAYAGGVLFGALVGVGAAVTTAVLMLGKTVAHSHTFPDYPVGQIVAMLARTPVWGMVGALLMLSALLIWEASHQ
jgi:hypothetical protein